MWKKTDRSFIENFLCYKCIQHEEVGEQHINICEQFETKTVN